MGKIRCGINKSFSLKPSLECARTLWSEVGAYSSSQGKGGVGILQGHEGLMLNHLVVFLIFLLAFLWDFPCIYQITPWCWSWYLIELTRAPLEPWAFLLLRNRGTYRLPLPWTYGIDFVQNDKTHNHIFEKFPIYRIIGVDAVLIMDLF